jgi:hypothetical protein
MTSHFKPIIKHAFLLAATLLMLLSCSRKNNSFMSRSWHSIGTEYNILYNGNVALEKGKLELINQYEDNYWQVLPVERMQVTEDISLPGEAKNANFEYAEEKAVKAIQKHSMYIDGKEKNPQIDEAYLLLGKARYYDQRFVPALEAFNYILFKYPASNTINHAKVWREKVNMRLDNNEVAIENLKRLIDKEGLNRQDLADATSSLAQAYININVIDSAIQNLEVAKTHTKSNEERGRYSFIQGQLYNKLEKRDSANMAFDKVIELNRKTARIYLINAHIEKAKNFNFQTGDTLQLLELLTDLEENRENKAFLDKIYRQKAEYFSSTGQDYLALHYYNESLKTNSKDKFLVAQNYISLGDWNFNQANYKASGAYYDSTLTQLEEKSRLYRKIQRKKENLKDVIYYENIAQRNDSILYLVSLPSEQRLAYFTDYIEELKAKEKEEQEQLEIAEAKERQAGNVNPLASMPNSEESGGFYFYNPTIVAYGKNEFMKIWGMRDLSDNWRRSKQATTDAILGDKNISALAENGDSFDPKFYMDQIPEDQTIIDSIAKERNNAYFQLGSIYKEKFQKNALAREKFESLLQNNPEKRLILPSKYNLYKIYVLLNETDKAQNIKEDILKNNPNTRYAALLLNPNQDLGADQNSPEYIYKELYQAFLDEDYTQVIEACDKNILYFDGEDIVPKFEFLKAISKARLYGYESYVEAINFIALNYPNSPEGKKAEEMIKTDLPKMANQEFVDDNEAKKFNLIYIFASDYSKEEIEDFKKKMNEAVDTIEYIDLVVSRDFYDENTNFIVVHGFNSLNAAKGLDALVNLKKNDPFIKEIKEHPYFTISSKNYEIVQRHKNLSVYLGVL